MALSNCSKALENTPMLPSIAQTALIWSTTAIATPYTGPEQSYPIQIQPARLHRLVIPSVANYRPKYPIFSSLPGATSNRATL